MNALLIYLLKSAFVFTVLFLVYYVVFRKLTFHTANRFFLLAILPLSLLFPVLDIEIYSPVIPAFNLEVFSDDFLAFDNVEAVSEGDHKSLGLNWSYVFVVLYFVGGIVFLFKLSQNIFNLLQIKRQSQCVKMGNSELISAKVPLVFSCFNWKFIPIQEYNSIDPAIIAHEKLHSRKGHTLDLLFLELYRVVFWFNPFVILFRRNIKAVHEYEVDAALVENEMSTSDYLQLVLNTLNSKTKTVGLYSYFNGLTLKKRIDMLISNKSSKHKGLRYLILVPIIALFSISFAQVSEKVAEKVVVESTKYIKVEKDEAPSIYPINKEELTRIASGFGYRIHPVSKEKKLHSGIDFAAPKGTAIVSTADGVVLKAEEKENFGKFVLIAHGKSIQTFYSHMSEIKVEVGDKVTKGSIIGLVGSTGMSLGDHLHYEVRVDGKPVDPNSFLSKN